MDSEPLAFPKRRLASKVKKERTESPELLKGEFPLPKIGETLLTSRKIAGGLDLTEFLLGRVFYR